MQSRRRKLARRSIGTVRREKERGGLFRKYVYHMEKVPMKERIISFKNLGVTDLIGKSIDRQLINDLVDSKLDRLITNIIFSA